MTEAAAGTGVLSGIKVVDFGHFVAGPLTAVMLADQGAEVVTWTVRAPSLPKRTRS